MLFSNVRRQFLSCLGFGAATSLVAGAQTVLAATPTDDELRRRAASQLMLAQGAQPFGLKSVGYDWKLEQQRLAEEENVSAEVNWWYDRMLTTMRRWLKDELAKDTLRPAQHKRFSGGITVPFATLPTNRYVRWEDEPVPELDGLMRDVERGDFTIFTKLVKDLSEDYRYPGSQRVAKLTKEHDHAGRAITGRLCIDMNELTTPKLAYMIGRLAVEPNEEIWNKIEESQRSFPHRDVKFVKDVEIQVYPKLDAYVLEVFSSVIWAGELMPTYIKPTLLVFNDYKAIR